jgi:hypothetical protein
VNGKQSERQDRVEELGEQGYSQAEAEGQARADEANVTPLPAHGVDRPGTIGLDRPGPKAA